MAELLTNVAVSDAYTNQATLGPTLGITQLVFQVFNEPIYARFFKPPVDEESNRQPTLDPTEHYFPVGTLLSVDGAAGVQFRNAIAGQPATINAQIGFAGDPIFDFQSSGLFSAAVLTLSFLHNNSLVGAESALDFEDSSSIVWSVVDTPGTKEAVSASFVSGSVVTSVFGRSGPAVVAQSGDYTAAQVTNAADKSSGATQLFSAALSTGPSSQTFSGAQTTGVFVGVTNGITAFNSVTFSLINAGLTTDTVPRFGINSSGLMQWGPGNAAIDTALSRLAVSVLGTSSGDNFSVNGLTAGNFGQQGVFLQAQGGTAWLACPAAGNNVLVISIVGDTERRLGVQAGGALTWGSGSAATDMTLGRVVNSPSGTGSFLELTAGAGLGYGVGTGGTVTIVNGSSGTLNKPTGKVTASAAIATGATGSYTVTNSVVGAQDVVIVNLTSGGGNTQRAYVTAVAAGSFTIFYENSSGVSQTPTFNFAVLKGSQS